MKTTPIMQFLQSEFSTEALALETRNENFALTLRSTTPTGWVEPEISWDQPDPGSPASPILLISAAGAMGKTFTSMAIADYLQAPRLDLSQLTVGQDTHLGVLTRALTPRSYGLLAQSLTEGKASLIIDALDEAPLRSGERAFFAFMESLAEDAKSFEVPKHQYVVLGRPQTIDLFRELCVSLGVNTTNVTLNSLSLNSSLDLIAKEIERISLSPVHISHPESSRDYWKEYLFQLGSMLLHEPDFRANQWPQVSDFIGYPPVVCAIAPMLDESNYLKSKKDLQNTPPGLASRATVLTKIIQDLLARETDKAQQQLGQAFAGEIEPTIIKTFYGYEEQIARILNELGVPMMDALPASLPDHLRGKYEGLLDSFIADHPFLNGKTNQGPRNVVFSDHLRAIVNSGSAFISGTSNKPVSSDQIPSVGPFYIHFMNEFLEKVSVAEDQVERPALLSEDFVQEILTSWELSMHADWHSTFQYAHYENQRPLLDFHVTQTDRAFANQANLQDLSVYFTIKQPDGVLQLSSPVTDVSVVSDYGLYIASSGGSTTLGPGASLVSQHIQFDNSDELHFRGQVVQSDDKFDVVAFILAQDLSISGDYKLRRSGVGMCSVIVPDLDQRWRDFEPKLRAIDGMNRENVLEAVMYLRRILSSFRSTNGVQALHIDKFNRHVIGRNKMLRTVRSAMEKADLISEKSGMMIMNQDVLSKFEINYSVYSDPDWVQKLSSVLAECMNRDPRLVEALMRRDD